MSDPYQVLGIGRDAAEDEIKKMYRKLSRKYHPDANLDNPDKESAEKKFREVQFAYKNIMNERTGGGSYGGYGKQDGFGGNESQTEATEEDVLMQAATNYINNECYREALNVLHDIESRGTKWYFFSGYVNWRIGNNVRAMEHAKVALAMDPDNLQYQELVKRMEGSGSWYEYRSAPYEAEAAGGSEFCWKLSLASLFCNMFCGGGNGWCFGSGLPFGRL